MVLLAPFSQGTHLLSVGRLIVVGDQAYHVVSSANLTMTLELCVAVQSSSQVTFIYIAILTIQIVTKQLPNIKMGK